MRITTCRPFPGLWEAIDSDSYDGADDARSPAGYGKTEEEAIADLLEQIEASA